MKAEEQPDPRARGVLDADGKRLQRLWACPLDGHTGDPDPATIPACKGTASLWSVDPSEVTRCPGWYSRQPEAHRVASALAWYRRGQLQLRDPWPSGALVDAIDVAESALARRETAELRRMRERAESKQR